MIFFNEHPFNPQDSYLVEWKKKLNKYILSDIPGTVVFNLRLVLLVPFDSVNEYVAFLDVVWRFEQIFHQMDKKIYSFENIETKQPL